MVSRPVEVYSGYRSMSPLTIAACAIGVPPRLSLRSTVKPAFSSNWAYSSATTNSSVKSFDPTLIVPVAPGATPSAAVGDTVVVASGAEVAAVPAVASGAVASGAVVAAVIAVASGAVVAPPAGALVAPPVGPAWPPQATRNIASSSARTSAR